MQSGLFIQIIPQALGPAGVAELAQGFGLDLAHPLPGDVELPAQLFQRPGAAILQTEAEGDDPLFPGRQALEHIHQLPAEQLPPGLVGGDACLIVLDEVLEVGVLFLPHRRLEADGVLSQLILGQDDGEPYSIPNIEKNRLRQFMAEQQLTEPQVFLTHGADEIALSILAGIQNQQTGFKPRILVRYNDRSTPDCIMPYMAISTEETVQEKIALLGGSRASAPEEADFTLLVSANDADTGTMGSRMAVVRQLQSARQAQQPTALVDLSKHFQPQETILPLLIDTGYPLNTLIAYAGWNTTSNSIGTALAQASLFTAAKRQSTSQDESIGLTAANLTFLQDRIMEDYFYLKEDIDCINHSLQKAGYTNTADLDLEHNWRWANAMLQQAMKRQLASYKYTKAFRAPVKFTSPAGNFSLMMQDMTMNISYPWPRTFEVWLQTKPFFTLSPDEEK